MKKLSLLTIALAMFCSSAVLLDAKGKKKKKNQGKAKPVLVVTNATGAPLTVHLKAEHKMHGNKRHDETTQTIANGASYKFSFKGGLQNVGIKVSGDKWVNLLGLASKAGGTPVPSIVKSPGYNSSQTITISQDLFNALTTTLSNANSGDTPVEGTAATDDGSDDDGDDE